ncbi:uncharacterized protein LOC144784954 isoform X2 [Lissotriton helveticus]
MFTRFLISPRETQDYSRICRLIYATLNIENARPACTDYYAEPYRTLNLFLFGVSSLLFIALTKFQKAKSGTKRVGCAYDV